MVTKANANEGGWGGTTTKRPRGLLATIKRQPHPLSKSPMPIPLEILLCRWMDGYGTNNPTAWLTGCLCVCPARCHYNVNPTKVHSVDLMRAWMRRRLHLIHVLLLHISEAAALPATAAEQLIKYHNLSNDNATGGGLWTFTFPYLLAPIPTPKTPISNSQIPNPFESYNLIYLNNLGLTQQPSFGSVVFFALIYFDGQSARIYLA